MVNISLWPLEVSRPASLNDVDKAGTTLAEHLETLRTQFHDMMAESLLELNIRAEGEMPSRAGQRRVMMMTAEATQDFEECLRRAVARAEGLGKAFRIAVDDGPREW